MGQIKFIGSLMMAALFSIMILGYAINFGVDNNVAVDISNDASIVKSNINLISNVSNFRSQANSSVDSFYKATIKPGDETTESGGYFKSITSMFSALKNILSIGEDTLGDSQNKISPVGISLTVLGAFLSIVSMLYIWKTWAGKNPD